MTVRRGGAAWLLLLLAVAGLGWFLALRREPPAATRGAAIPAARSAEPGAAASQPTPSRVTARIKTPLWRLQASVPQEASLVALGLRPETGGATAWLVPLMAFPLSGEVQDAKGSAVAVRVVTWSLDQGFVLFTTTAAIPDDVVPVAARAASTLANGATVTAVAADGQAPVERVLQARSATGLLTLDQQVEPASALLDGGGRAVGYALGDREALSIEGAIAWLGAPGQQELDVAQREIRARSPQHVLDDARKLLDGDVDSIRRAIALLDSALLMVRDGAAWSALETQLRAAHQALIVALNESSAAAALAQARQSLERFPQEPWFLANAAVLALKCDDGLGAIAYYRRLLLIAPDRAAAIAESMVAGLLQIGRQRLRENRVADAIGPLLGGVELFPARAELRAAYARALQQAGELEAAWFEASEAARLDPAHLELSRQLADRVQRTRDPARVEIPFDPDTHVVRAEVSVNGVPLQLVVDTGASLTTIPSAVADRLGLRNPSNRRIQIQTASGLVEGELVQLPVLAIGGLRLARVNAVVLDLPGILAGSGLLGMNVLSRWNLQIDSQNGRLVLQTTPGGGRR